MNDIFQYVIYDNPKDYPGQFVLRKWIISKGTIIPGPLLATGEAIEDVRDQLPENVSKLPVYENDDPAIAEVWM